MTRRNASRNRFIPVFAIAAIALVFAGTMVVTSEDPDTGRFIPQADSAPVSAEPIHWDVG